MSALSIVVASVTPSLEHASVAVLAVMGLMVGAAYVQFGVSKVHGLFNGETNARLNPLDSLPSIEAFRLTGQHGSTGQSFGFEAEASAYANDVNPFPTLLDHEDFADTVGGFEMAFDEDGNVCTEYDFDEGFAEFEENYSGSHRGF